MKPHYVCVAENLYRREPSGGYYARWKISGKTNWKALHTEDRKLAERRLADFLRGVQNLKPQGQPAHRL